MISKKTKSVAIVLMLIAIIMLLFVTIDNPIVNKILADKELRAYNELRYHYTTSQDLKDFLDYYPQAPQEHLDSIKYLYEKTCFEEALADSTEYAWNDFIRKFPNGQFTSKAEKYLRDMTEPDAFKNACSSDTEYAYENYLKDYPDGANVEEIKRLLNRLKEREKWDDNSLDNGSQPYAAYYGKNLPYKHGRPTVVVNAPYSSDVVVVVRHNNAEGDVAGHVYVQRSNTASIQLQENKKYQVFFYYGRGWNPEKLITEKIQGGFTQYESYAKDGESIQLSWGQIITYSLEDVKNGNFSTEPSSGIEFFL